MRAHRTKVSDIQFRSTHHLMSPAVGARGLQQPTLLYGATLVYVLVAHKEGSGLGLEHDHVPVHVLRCCWLLGFARGLCRLVCNFVKLGFVDDHHDLLVAEWHNVATRRPAHLPLKQKKTPQLFFCSSTRNLSPACQHGL